MVVSSELEDSLLEVEESEVISRKKGKFLIEFEEEEMESESCSLNVPPLTPLMVEEVDNEGVSPTSPYQCQEKVAYDEDTQVALKK